MPEVAEQAIPKELASEAVPAPVTAAVVDQSARAAIIRLARALDAQLGEPFSTHHKEILGDLDA